MRIVSRSSFASACKYCISSSSNVSNLWTPNSNTVPNSFGISNKVLLGTSDWINSDNLLPCVNRSTRSSVHASACAYGLIVISIFSASLRFSDWLETNTMKLHSRSFKSHLTYLKFQWESKAKEDYKPEKKVADQHWQRTDSIHNISKLHAFPMF